MYSLNCPDTIRPNFIINKNKHAFTLRKFLKLMSINNGEYACHRSRCVVSCNHLASQ